MTQKNEVAIIQKDITDDVNNSLERLQDDGLKIPTSYSASNALKSAFFKLRDTKDKTGKSALDVCTRESIANTLLDMTVQGLSPAKTQCYFIVYGNQLQLNRSYFGTQAVLKRLNNVKDIWANVIYKDDVFDYEVDGGREKLLKHETNFLNRDNAILGAYAVVKTSEDEEILTIMTMKEINASWSQSKTQQAVHKKFPQEMAKRTVINRAAKAFINTSDDSDLLVEAINNSTENEYDNERKDITPEQEAKQEISENANSEYINVEYNEPEEPKKEPVVTKKENPTKEDDLEQVAMNFGNEQSNDGPGF